MLFNIQLSNYPIINFLPDTTYSLLHVVNVGAVFTRLEQVCGARALVSIRTGVPADEVLQLMQMQLHRSSSALFSGPGPEQFQGLKDANAALGLSLSACTSFYEKSFFFLL